MLNEWFSLVSINVHDLLLNLVVRSINLEHSIGPQNFISNSQTLRINFAQLARQESREKDKKDSDESDDEKGGKEKAKEKEKKKEKEKSRKEKEKKEKEKSKKDKKEKEKDKEKDKDRDKEKSRKRARSSSSWVRSAKKVEKWVTMCGFAYIQFQVPNPWQYYCWDYMSCKSATFVFRSISWP